MNTLFKNNYGIKIRRYNLNLQKVIIIPDDIYQTNKNLFVKVQQKMVVN